MKYIKYDENNKIIFKDEKDTVDYKLIKINDRIKGQAIELEEIINKILNDYKVQRSQINSEKNKKL